LTEYADVEENKRYQENPQAALGRINEHIFGT
jgi:hypothetical protein